MKKAEGAQNAGLNRNALWTSSLLALGALAIAPGAALAQDSSGAQLDDIVVVAQKRSENLQDVPITVTALPAEVLQSSGLVDTTSLPTLVSGLTVSTPAASFQAYIRGIGTTAFGPGIENPVALYIDDVYYSSQVTAFSDLTDLSQVAVLKGPQGTLFGRNSTGGVIQLTTRDPDTEFGGEFRTELDNYLTSRNNLYITGPLGDSVSANLSLSYTTQDEGWGENLATGNDNHQIDHDYSVRSKWIITPTEDTTIRLKFDWVDREGSQAPNLIPIAGTQPFQQPPGSSPTNSYDTNNAFDTLVLSDGGGFSVDFEHDFGGARFVSISAYRTSDFFIQFDPSLGPIPGIRQRYKQQTQTATQEFQLVSPASETFNWVIGAFYMHGNDDMPYFEQNNYNYAAACPACFPQAAEQQLLASIELETESAALFGQTTFKVFDDTNLTLGARYTDETRSLNAGILELRAFGLFFDLPPFGAVAGGDLTLALPVTPSELSYSQWTYRAALDHQFSDDVMGYVSYNYGFKSGGFNAFNPSDPAAYEPETVDSYELGLKTELFDRRVRLNTALFYNEFSDIQVISFVGLPNIRNAASAKTYGVDVDVQANLTEHFSLMGGMEYLNTEFGAGSIGNLMVAGPGGVGAITTLGPIDGNELPYAPEWTANVALTYDRTYDWGNVVFNITNAYSAGFYGAESNVPEVVQDSYNILNTSVTWTSTSGALSLGLFGRNLLDEMVATQLGTGTFGFLADYGNPPQTYGASLKYRWGAYR